ncbi:MAG: non-heme iron oxygenase ferredoxin subunit [Patescibacteria group bacterium]
MLYEACKTNQVKIGEIEEFTVQGIRLAIYNVEGRFYATQDECSHQKIPLSQGYMEGTWVECPEHGSKFDITTGAVRGLPATLPIKIYPVTIQGDSVMVDIT